MSDPLNDMYLTDKQTGERLKKEISAAGLLTSKKFKTATPEEVARAYNGCGPEKWPQFARNVANHLARLFRLAVVIHDFDFENSDGSREKFDEANARFAKNCRKLHRSAYPIFTAKRLRADYWTESAFWFLKAKAISYFVTTDAGFAAWEAGAK